MINHNFKKSLGQNFLRFSHLAKELVSSANILEDTMVIEIGPGNGMVTDVLVSNGFKPTLIEKDDELIDFLAGKYKESVSIVHKDVLKVDFDSLTNGNKYIVLGSLPYNISKKIIQILLLAKNKPHSMSFIIQKEVASSYVAKSPKSTLLANYANLYSDVKAGKVIGAKIFYPAPKVDGQIISFKNIYDRYPNNQEIWSLIRQGFSSPRKVLSNNLRKYGSDKVKKSLEELNINPTARAAELTTSQWVKLLDNIND